jgi:hypothetical protein
MNIYNNVEKMIQECATKNPDSMYVDGLRDCYYIFKKYFYHSGIYNQHYLQHVLDQSNNKIEHLKYEKSNLEYDLKIQRETYTKIVGLSKSSMADNIKSLETEVRRLKKLNDDLYKQLVNNDK